MMPKRSYSGVLLTLSFSSFLGKPLVRWRYVASRVLVLGLAALPFCVPSPSSAQSVGVVERWKLQLQPGALPIVGANGELYAAVDRRLFNIDPRTGVKRWSFYAGGTGLAGIPSVSTSAEPSGPVLVGSWGPYSYALEARTGEVRWGFASDEPPPGAAYHQPLPGSDGLVYLVPTFGEKLFAVSLLTGERKWEYVVSNRAFFSPPAMSSNGRLYFAAQTSSNRVHCLDARTGRLVWEFGSPARDIGFSQPAVGTEGIVVVVTDTGGVYALDGVTGNKRWEYQTRENNGSRKAPLLDDQGTIFVGTTGALHAIDVRSGALKWKNASLGELMFNPTLSKDGSVYLLTYDRASDRSVFHAVTGRDGKEQWSFPLQGNAAGSPQVGDDGTIYLCDGSGILSAWIGGQIDRATATATAQTVNGFLIGVTITSQGAGYTNVPNVTVASVKV